MLNIQLVAWYFCSGGWAWPLLDCFANPVLRSLNSTTGCTIYHQVLEQLEQTEDVELLFLLLYCNYKNVCDTFYSLEIT